MARYPTRPLECWQKAKELRLAFYREVAVAREEGKLVTSGSVEAPFALAAGLGDFVHLPAEPYGANVATDPTFARECAEAVEARGFARDLCAYMRNYWGSMFLDRYFFGGPFPRPDFCLQIHFCDSHAKWFQVVSEHLGVPHFCLEVPVGYGHEEETSKLEYLAGQMLDAIEWMEKVTGREYNDERLIEAVRNECLTSSLWGEVMCLNKAVPAPLDMKSILALYMVAGVMRDRKEAVEFNRLLRDEVKERVEQGIAALGDERCRLIGDSAPPWYFLRLYRYLEGYGIIIVCSWYSMFLIGNVAEQPDGTWGRAPTPEEVGMPLKTREDAVRAYAWWLLNRPFIRMITGRPESRVEAHLRIYREWRGQGLILDFNRGCELLTMSAPEIYLSLQKHNIPMLILEHNMGDRRDFDEAQVMDRVDAFIESLGLKG